MFVIPEIWKEDIMRIGMPIIYNCLKKGESYLEKTSFFPVKISFYVFSSEREKTILRELQKF